MSDISGFNDVLEINRWLEQYLKEEVTTLSEVEDFIQNNYLGYSNVRVDTNTLLPTVIDSSQNPQISHEFDEYISVKLRRKSDGELRSIKQLLRFLRSPVRWEYRIFFLFKSSKLVQIYVSCDGIGF